jgi:hypothetical protein
LVSCPFRARVLMEHRTLLGERIKSSSSSTTRVTIFPNDQAGDYRFADANEFLPEQGEVAPGLLIQFRIGALIRAHVNPGINGEAAGPSLHHEIHGDKAFQEGNGELHTRIGALRIVSDGDLISP